MSLQQQQNQDQQPPPSSDAPLPSSPTPIKPSSTEPTTTQSLSSTTNPRLTALLTKQTTLNLKLATLQSQRTTLIASATLPSGLAMPADWTEEQKVKQALATANAIIKEHIALLHGYNEIKDVGMGLMGLVADQRGVRQQVVMEEFGITGKD